MERLLREIGGENTFFITQAAFFFLWILQWICIIKSARIYSAYNQGKQYEKLSPDKIRFRRRSCSYLDSCPYDSPFPSGRTDNNSRYSFDFDRILRKFDFDCLVSCETPPRCETEETCNK